MKMIGHDHFICHSYSHFFRAFSHTSIRQDMTFRKKSDDLF